MGLIKKDDIEKVVHTANIEEVVGEVVKLKRAGSNLSGLCPFHNEKTPSFVVTPSKNIFKCFGCGKGGDSIDFVREYNHVGFTEAVKILAKKYSIDIQEKELTDEDHQRAEIQNQLRDLYVFAAKFYHEILISTKPEPESPYEYLSKRILPESIEIWKLGFAPAKKDAFTLHAVRNGYAKELLLKSKLTRVSDKTGELYDFFRDRIIFPVFDNAGRITSFAGRLMPGVEGPKYINLPESDLYHKRELLYGFSQAVRIIREQKNVYITEGYTDVIRMHEMGFVNTVASAGTAFTTDQLNALRKHTLKVTLLRDGDNAGLNAAFKDGRLLIENKLVVYIVPLPEGNDPADAWQSDEDAQEYIKKNTLDFISFYANYLIEKAGTDPLLRNDAITQIAEILFNLDKTVRELYTQNISKQTKLKAKLISDKLKEMETINGDTSDFSSEILLPDGVDPIDFERFGFYEYKNEYYFRTQKGHEKLSNFKMTPLFHVNTINDSKRIYELHNSYNFKVVVDLDMQEMTSLQAFQRNIEGRGNFLFWGMPAHFNRLKLMLYEQTTTCTEITVLGWQKEGFFAWANGVSYNGQFNEIDEYGIIKVENETFFIPAYSKIYIKDKSVYLDERNFRFIQRNITLNMWIEKFRNAFAENALLGIAFWIATLFRDAVINVAKNFPILNLFGPKGSGKSQMAMSLLFLFGKIQNAYNIHNGTKASLAEHLQQFSNAFAWIDEYKNNIEYEKIETLKSIYDSVGRSRMNIKKGNKKETTRVTAGAILSGQEMPTADVALFSRLIFVNFTKTTFTDEESRIYDDLKKFEEQGLSCLSADMMQYREHFQNNFSQVYNETLSDMSGNFSDDPVEGRILRNMVSIVAAWRTIAQKVEFPFSYPEILDVAIRSVRTQNNQISKSSEIGMFWNMFEAMFDDNTIKDQWQFRIDYTDEIKTKRNVIALKEPANVLKFKYNTIYASYAHAARKQSSKPLPSDTLMYYLKNNPAYIGIQDQTVFTETIIDPSTKLLSKKTQNTSAMCFYYDMLNINLIRKDEEPTLPEYKDPKNPYKMNNEPVPY